MEQTFDPERLRPIECVGEADPRNLIFALIDPTGSCRPMTLADRHAEIAECVLHEGVQEDVRIQFETAKNIYLYSWFVYRFFTVAEHHSYTCLELALRERLKTEIASGKFGSKMPTLRSLLRCAVDYKLIRNEAFANWRNRGELNSRHRAEMEALRKMSENNLEILAFDYSTVQITEDDLDWDYANKLVDTLPVLRN